MENGWPKAWPTIGLIEVLHIFDPNGDVLLQLENTMPIKASASDGFTPTIDNSPVLELPPEEETLATEEALPFEPLHDTDSPDLQSSAWTERNDACGWRAHQLGPEEEPELHSLQTVYLRVSSKHLILASDMFETMLSPDKWGEGRRLQSEGNLVIKLPDDPSSLIILMYIIHGMTRKVPRDVNLDTLTKLAHLISYYQLHEAVELFSDTWISCLKGKAFPTSHSPEVIPWLFISWVFQKGDEFEKLTRILEYESDDKLQDDVETLNGSFLIPPSIVCRIEEHRVEAIERTITVVHDYITRYLTPDILCSNDKQFACDAIMLGSLLKSSAAIGIWPQPKVPYHGITFKNLASQVRNMQVLDNCSQRNNKYYGSGPSHGVKDTIEASIMSLEDQLCGLNLDSFLPEMQRRKGDKADKKNKQKKKKKGKGSIPWGHESDSIDRRVE